MSNPPNIYIAHPVTGEFVGTGYPDPDPLDADNWLVPAHAFLDAPPDAAVGKSVVRGADGWEVVEDLRGTVYSTVTGEASFHGELGELPVGFTPVARPSPAHKWVNKSWALDAALAAELEQARLNSEALAYLSETDWYIIRQLETGVPIPDDIPGKRAEARALVVR